MKSQFSTIKLGLLFTAYNRETRREYAQSHFGQRGQVSAERNHSLHRAREQDPAQGALNSPLGQCIFFYQLERKPGVSN